MASTHIHTIRRKHHKALRLRQLEQYGLHLELTTAHAHRAEINAKDACRLTAQIEGQRSMMTMSAMPGHAWLTSSARSLQRRLAFRRSFRSGSAST